MGRTSFDWRWIIIVVIALLFFGLVDFTFNPIVGVLLLALGSYLMIQAGLGSWGERGGPVLGNTKVTYWRGQRIVLPRNEPVARRLRLRTPAGISLITSVFYLALGAGYALAAVLLLLRLLGIRL